MKALVYTQPNEVRIQERPRPTLTTGEVVLQIEAVGICGSDMHAYHGHDPRRKPGLVLGHEFCGTVIDSDVPHIQPGQRFTGNPLITCGHCDYCLQGRNNLCSNRTMIGMTRAGAFAQCMSIPAASLVDIPQDMPAVTAALTEPAATALHAIHLSQRAMTRPLAEQRTLVIGGGAIGMLSALLLRSQGCPPVTVAEVNALRRDSVARHAGALVIDPIQQAPDENAFDFVIDAVGSKITRQTALAAVRPGGVIVHVGLQDWASEIDMRKLTLAEITLIGTYTYSTADLRATVGLLGRGAFGTLEWVQTLPLEEGARAFSNLHEGKTASAKVVLVP
ncbi:MAG: L-threonine 3-dehydrogenase [Pseudomonadota bacterium]|jgi:alcohol dehydrogenase